MCHQMTWQRSRSEIGGTPYDIENVEFGHVGDRCSFDAIVKAYGIEDACAGPPRHHRTRC